MRLRACLREQDKNYIMHQFFLKRKQRLMKDDDAYLVQKIKESSCAAAAAAATTRKSQSPRAEYAWPVLTFYRYF